MISPVLGLDIGGANLKAAHASGDTVLRPYELWKNPAGLADALRSLLAELPPFERLAITMTGELCDCFTTRREGVLMILDAAAAVAGAAPVRVWTTDGCFVNLDQARAAPLTAAAANWLALATYAGRNTPPTLGLLIDIGSTTADLVPLRDGCPVPRGRNDWDRLQHGELVYTGVRRTPICAMLGETVVPELFATTLDAYLMLGLIREDPADCHTADGRPATISHAHARLARMVLLDPDTTPTAETLKLARQVLARQCGQILGALGRVLEHRKYYPEVIVLAGSGEFLAQMVLHEFPPGFRPRPSIISLAEVLGPQLSAAACAYAVAVLAAEEGT
jgi:probable H4MPT-linked C1 transfer pathway protein